ncbi:hypothetical protein BKA70DRAFT_1313851 [Coprinopsis sp. MPI-PUGE-AT-0042]|nr:hypothetical protein BKA70DRAFT_1313851 [Coprinopsis sp. MPI-PUGE-AT-0042]
MPKGSRAQLPTELVSLIASSVGESVHAVRNRAIAACRLACSTFAVIFRPLLFEFLDISNVGVEDSALYRMIERRISLLIGNPEYARLVKRVTITFATDPWDERPLPLSDFTGNHPAFAQLLNLLPCVSSLYLDSTLPDSSFSFEELCDPSRVAIQRICSLPSLKSLEIASWLDFPLEFFTSLHPTNLESLRFHYSGSYWLEESLVVRLDVAKASIELLAPLTGGSPIHLYVSHRWPEMCALKPLGHRITQASVLVSISMVLLVQDLVNGCASLRQLRLTLSDTMSISQGRLDLSPCKQLSELTICFQRVTGRGLSDISRFVSEAVSSCSQGMRSIEVIFKCVTAGMDMSEWMELLERLWRTRPGFNHSPPLCVFPLHFRDI